MNIEHKKTVLDDDSILYQKRDESFKKKDISNLDAAGKAGYFKDYYMKPLLVIILVTVFAIYMIYTIFIKEQETILSVAFLNECYLEQTTELNEDLRSVFELTSEDQLMDVAYYNLNDYTMQMKFTTLTAAQAMDVIVCPREAFEHYSTLGFFADLSTVLPAELYAEVEDRLLLSSEVETDIDGAILQTFPPAPHGIDISGNALYADYLGHGDDVVLAIVAGTQRTENAIKFVDHMLHYEAGSRPAISETKTERVQ